MHGLVVIGTSSGAGEREVAEALAAGGRVFESGSLIAAKLAGAEKHIGVSLDGRTAVPPGRTRPPFGGRHQPEPRGTAVRFGRRFRISSRSTPKASRMGR